jgi:hypothetical protein
VQNPFAFLVKNPLSFSPSDLFLSVVSARAQAFQAASRARRVFGAIQRVLLAGVFFLISTSGALAEGKAIVLFATMTEDTPVTLADGAQWMMDKGDSFPVLMFKEQQTKVLLQLAGTNFLAPMTSVRILEENQITSEELAAYRRNVVNYLEGKVKKWRQAVVDERGK